VNEYAFSKRKRRFAGGAAVAVARSMIEALKACGGALKGRALSVALSRNSLRCAQMSCDRTIALSI